jgi:hypothetical protein
MKFDEKGNEVRELDPAHPNPFWKEQEALITDEDKRLDAKWGTRALKIYRLWNWWQCRKMKRGNPFNWKKREAELERLVQQGIAERWGEMTGVGYDHCKEIIRTYEEAEQQREFSMHGVVKYDNEFKFLDRVVLYKVRNSPK